MGPTRQPISPNPHNTRTHFMTAPDIPQTSEPQLQLGYLHQTESFAARLEGANDFLFGASTNEYLTPHALIDAARSTGYTIPPEHESALHDTARQILQDQGDYSIVGVNSRLFTVSPNNAVHELHSDGKYSPDGFSWGYDGSGPRQTARAVLEVTHGPTAAADHSLVSDYASDVLATVPSQQSTFEIRGSDAHEAVPHINLSSPRIDTVIAQLDTIDLRRQSGPPQFITATHTPTADSNLIFAYRPQSESYEAAAIPRDPTQPTVAYGHEPGGTPTPESLLSQLAADGHRPTQDQLTSLAELQTQVRTTRGEHTIVGHTNLTDGTRHLHLITPTNNAHPILPTGSHSPDGYNWGYHGSGTNETAQQIANTVLGVDHSSHPEVVANLRSALADITTNNFSLSASDAAKPSHPLDITQSPHLGIHHAKSIASASPPAPAIRPTGPSIGITF